jgi:hypothetical protein
MLTCPRNYQSIAQRQKQVVADAQRITFALHSIMLDVAFFWPKVPLENGQDTPIGLSNADILCMKILGSNALSGNGTLTKEGIMKAVPKLDTFYGMLGLDVVFIREWVPSLLHLLRALHRSMWEIWQREYRPDTTMVDLPDLEAFRLLEDKLTVSRLLQVRISRVTADYHQNLLELTKPSSGCSLPG